MCIDMRKSLCVADELSFLSRGKKIVFFENMFTEIFFSLKNKFLCVEKHKIFVASDQK